MKVNLRKKEEGGFINPVYEKRNRRIGIVMLLGLAVLFIYLLVLVCTDYPAWNYVPGVTDDLL